MFPSTLRALLRSWCRPSAPTRRVAEQRWAPPTVESLESRFCPAPITITQGGYYSHQEFSSTDRNTPAVNILTSQLVVLDHCYIHGKTSDFANGSTFQGLIQADYYGNPVNVKIVDCTIVGENPGGTYQSQAHALRAIRADSVDFEHNSVTGTTGVFLAEAGPNPTTYTCKYNNIVNMNNRFTNGHGGYFDWAQQFKKDGTLVHQVEFAAAFGLAANLPNVDISANVIWNEPGVGSSGDFINLQGGTAASFAQVHDNLLVGNYSTDSYRTGADKTNPYYDFIYTNTNTAIDAEFGQGYTEVYSNTVIGGNLIINGGHDVWYYYNLVIDAGVDGNGRRVYGGGGGIDAVDYYRDKPGSHPVPFYDNLIVDNVVGGIDEAKINNYGGVFAGGNTLYHGTGVVTYSDQWNEIYNFYNQHQDAVYHFGPRP